MQGMSERQYARRAGLSRGAIQKAKRSGRLVLHDDGSIDAAASDVRRAAATDPAKSRATPPERRPVSGAAISAVHATLREQGLDPGADEGAMYLEAKTATEIARAQERRVRLRQMRGQLIDRRQAEALVSRLARAGRDAWARWPARVAAQIAADAGADSAAVQAALERHVRAHLGELSEIRTDFR